MKNNLFKKITIVLWNVIFLVLFFEIFSNIYYFFQSKEFFYTRDKSKSEASQVPVIYQTKLAVFHPYLGFVNHEGRRDKYASNNHGFQFYRPWIEKAPTAWDYPLKKEKDDLIVGIFGGSVGLGFAEEAQKSGKFAEYLSKIPRFKDKKIKILNFSVSGFRQPQQLLTLAYYLMLGQEFDLVINIDGFNETVNSVINWNAGLEPTYPADTVWGAMGRALEQGKIPVAGADELLAAYYERTAKIERQKAERAHIASVYLFYMLASKYHQHRHATLLKNARDKMEAVSWFPAKHRYTFGDKVNLAEYTADRWCDSSILMARMMQEKGEYLHVLQPDQWFHKSGDYTPIDPNHIYKWVIDPVNQFYPEFIKRIPELQKEGVDVFDATMIFKGMDYRKIYADDCCHFTSEGYETLFKKIANHLKEKP